MLNNPPLVKSFLFFLSNDSNVGMAVDRIKSNCIYLPLSVIHIQRDSSFNVQLFGLCNGLIPSSIVYVPCNGLA